MKQQRLSLRAIAFLTASILLASTAFAQSCADYDSNGDGQVDAIDLVLVLSEAPFSGAQLGTFLAAWTSCQPCPGDYNGDGVVDGGDLGIVLSLYSQGVVPVNYVNNLLDVLGGGNFGNACNPGATTLTTATTPATQLVVKKRK